MYTQENFGTVGAVGLAVVLNIAFILFSPMPSTSKANSKR
jgi:hypothetical protein